MWKSTIDAVRGESPVITIAGGEESKDLPTLRRLWKKLWQYKVDRGQRVLLIGGGSTLDIGGFAAATWKRGVPFVSLPTSLIAQIDAAFGGKVGLNFRKGKNLIGTFAEAEAVWIFPDFLHTLSPRLLRSGWVEAYKHALIAGGELWEKLQATSFSQLPSLDLLRSLVEVKLRIVERDPYELHGIRQQLNLGHTLGHLWETLSQDTSTPLLHGEAVAIGIIQETFISMQANLLSEQSWQKILHKLRTEGLLLPLPPFTWEKWERVLLQDKKIRNRQLFLPLLTEVGSVQLLSVEIHEVKRSVKAYRTLQSG
ncbi:MAG: 3-dehydroquinate synthase [Bacteroidia bacterium]|nr:3-dehydroquinate synthase [Bacteroidia bacterium]